MQTLGRVIVVLTLLAQFVYSAGVSASVSNNEVIKGNVAQLQISAEVAHVIASMRDL